MEFVLSVFFDCFKLTSIEKRIHNLNNIVITQNRNAVGVPLITDTSLYHFNAKKKTEIKIGKWWIAYCQQHEEKKTNRKRI